MRTPTIALSAIVAAALALAGCRQGEAPPATANADASQGRDSGTPATPGEAAARMPGLQVTTLDGQPYDLADHRGKWVVVNYWATWCSPCLEEMPELSALAAMRGHVEVLGLAYEDIEAEALQAFLDEHPVTYPVAIVDILDPPADFPAPRGLPMTWLVGPDGRVAGEFLGPVTAASLEQAIAAAGGPAPGAPLSPP